MLTNFEHINTIFPISYIVRKLIKRKKRQHICTKYAFFQVIMIYLSCKNIKLIKHEFKSRKS